MFSSSLFQEAIKDFFSIMHRQRVQTYQPNLKNYGYRVRQGNTTRVRPQLKATVIQKANQMARNLTHIPMRVGLRAITPGSEQYWQTGGHGPLCKCGICLSTYVIPNREARDHLKIILKELATVSKPECIRHNGAWMATPHPCEVVSVYQRDWRYAHCPAMDQGQLTNYQSNMRRCENLINDWIKKGSLKRVTRGWIGPMFPIVDSIIFDETDIFSHGNVGEYYVDLSVGTVLRDQCGRERDKMGNLHPTLKESKSRECIEPGLMVVNIHNFDLGKNTGQNKDQRIQIESIVKMFSEYHHSRRNLNRLNIFFNGGEKFLNVGKAMLEERVQLMANWLANLIRYGETAVIWMGPGYEQPTVANVEKHKKIAEIMARCYTTDTEDNVRFYNVMAGTQTTWVQKLGGNRKECIRNDLMMYIRTGSANALPHWTMPTYKLYETPKESRQVRQAIRYYDKYKKQRVIQESRTEDDSVDEYESAQEEAALNDPAVVSAMRRILKCSQCNQVGHHCSSCPKRSGSKARKEKEIKCLFCVGTEHETNQCPHTRITCYRCGEAGHIAPQCTYLKKNAEWKPVRRRAKSSHK